MKIVGCDFHPSFQQIAILDTTTGEIEQRRLGHRDGEAELFYRELDRPALIGMTRFRGEVDISVDSRWGLSAPTRRYNKSCSFLRWRSVEACENSVVPLHARMPIRDGRAFDV